MAQKDVYLDPDAAGTGSGADWTNAYTSMSALEAAEQADFVTSTTNLYVHFKSSSGGDDTTACVWDGSVTSETYDIKIISEDPPTKWDESKYILKVSDTISLTINDNWMTVEGMQLETTNPSANNRGCLSIDSLASGTKTNIRKCLFKGHGNSTYRERLIYIGAGRTVYFYNNVVFGANTTNTSGGNVCVGLNGVQDTTFYYNTFSGGYNTFSYVAATSVVAKNCIFEGAGNIVAGTWSAGTDYNTSDKGTTTGGANDQTSKTFTFTNKANGDFSLQSGDSGARGYATDLSADAFPVTDDLIDTTRSDPFDCGAYEYVAVVTGNPWYYYAQS